MTLQELAQSWIDQATAIDKRLDVANTSEIMQKYASTLRSCANQLIQVVKTIPKQL